MIKNKIIPILIVLLLLISSLAFYFYNKASRLNDSPDIKSKKEATDLISKVNKLILLPDDEFPTIATINDLDKLKDQPFFSKAKIGDKVIMYPKAKKAYLYNPDSNILVEVASVNVGK